MIRLRLLFLLPFAARLDAVHGGGRVIAQFLAEITARHKVAILCFREADEPGTDPFFRERCERVIEVVRPSSRKSPGARLLRYFRLALSLTQVQPVWVADWSSKSFAKKARSIAREFQPQIIQAEFHVMGQYFAALNDVEARRALVEHESRARAAPYLQNLPPILGGLINRVEKTAWRRYQARLYRQADAIVAFTEADRRSIEEAAGETPIHLIPPGTAIPEHPLDPVGSHRPNLLFVGNFFHPPNVDAARRLVESIFPSVQKRFPETRLYLVGDHLPVEIAARSAENIIVTGRVPDVTPYLDQAALFVAPLYLGGGMRIKVLEALAAGKAVVTTPLAIEGLDLINGKEVSIAASDMEFVESIIYLLEHAAERASIAKHARAWACEHLGWDQSIRKYETLYTELLEKSAGPAIRGEASVNRVG